MSDAIFASTPSQHQLQHQHHMQQAFHQQQQMAQSKSHVEQTSEGATPPIPQSASRRRSAAAKQAPPRCRKCAIRPSLTFTSFNRRLPKGARSEHRLTRLMAPTRTSWTPVVSSISRVICLRKLCISITLRRVLFLRVLSRHADISTSIPACSTSFKTRRCCSTSNYSSKSCNNNSNRCSIPFRR